jgi:hypothetical protein
MSGAPDVEQVRADAVAGLFAALTRRDSGSDALGVCWCHNPLFASTLISEPLRQRFPPGSDFRLVTAFTARIRA